MKDKINSKEKNLFKFIQSNDLDFPFETSQFLGISEKSDDKEEKNKEKIAKKTDKRAKNSKKIKNTENLLVKKVVKLRKKISKKADQIERKNEKRINKCNDFLLDDDPEYREIYLTIDKFNTNGKKTVVYFIDSFYPVIDGVVSVLDNYATYMQKYYNVVICCPKHKNKTFKSEKYFVLASDSLYVKNQGYDLGFPQLDLVFQKLISLLKIDLIHVQSPFNMGNFGVSLAKKRKIPCLTTFHSQFKQNFQNAVKNEPLATLLTRIVMGIYQRSTVAVTMNNFARNLMKEYGLKKQVELIPNATNLKPKQFDEKFEKDLLKKHKIDKDKFNIIFIGRFVEVKNVYFILDSIIELYKTNKDFNFIFLGYGPEQNKMQKICKENGLENIVKFTGKIDSEDEKAILIKNSNLLFFPSVYDTDGIVRIECACYSVPTLCIEETGVASSLKDNVNGYIEKYSKEAFSKRMDVLIKNKEETKKVGERAFKEIYITWEGVCEKLFNLYEETLKNFLTKNIKKKSKNKNAKTEK